MIPFNNIPANWKLPLWWAEVDSSRAGTHVIDMPALLIGVRKGGVAADNAIVAVASVDQANSLWGQGSMIARSAVAPAASVRAERPTRTSRPVKSMSPPSMKPDPSIRAMRS